MKKSHELSFGSETWTVEIDAAKLVPLSKPSHDPGPEIAPREWVQQVLERPYQFEPIRRALTPDDLITIYIDQPLPQIAELLNGVLEYLVKAGVAPQQITLLTRDGAPSDFLDDLSDEFADVKTETHHPEDIKKLAYLATTKAGRRVYLNRTLVESDFSFILSRRSYDPEFGYAGGEVAIFPTLSDEETRNTFAAEFSWDAPGVDPNARLSEAREVAQLLGSPCFIQVIEGTGDSVGGLVAGLVPSCEEGIRVLDTCWRAQVDERPELVVIAAGSKESMTLQQMAQLASAGARIVRERGRVVILTPPLAKNTGGIARLRRMEEPEEALSKLAKFDAEVRGAVYLWAYAASTARVFWYGCRDEDEAEALFTVPLSDLKELQRLLDSARRVAIVSDGEKRMLEVE